MALDTHRVVFRERERELTYQGADADDEFATTESELAASAGEVADSEARASGTTIAATPVAKSVGGQDGVGLYFSPLVHVREFPCVFYMPYNEA